MKQYICELEKNTSYPDMADYRIRVPMAGACILPNLMTKRCGPENNIKSSPENHIPDISLKWMWRIGKLLTSWTSSVQSSSGN